MLHRRFLLNVVTTICLVLGGAAFIGKAAPLAKPAQAYLPGYAYYTAVSVRNPAASTLDAGYTVGFKLDTAHLVSAGRMQADCDDLRISYTEDVTEVEIDRFVTGCNTTSTTVQFRTQDAIDPDSTDARYTLNYGNPTAADPLQNPANVFAFYDDFQDGNANGWNAVKGNWLLVNDNFNYVYRYTGGGDGWALSYSILPLSDVDLLAKVRAVDSPMTNWIGLAFRIQGENDFLTFYQGRDTNQFKYARIVNNNHNIVSQPPFTMAAGAWYWIRLQAVGSSVRARIWADGSPEPGSWLISQTDATYLTRTNIGLTLYNHITNADWDDIQARRLVAVEPVVTLYSWWNADFHYRTPLTVTNTSAANPLPTRYSARAVVDTQSLIASGQMLPTCADLRVAFDTGLNPVEIDRVVENCGSTQTVVWFPLQRAVPIGGADLGYSLYYGNAAAGSPPANGMNVFLYFEDWEQGTLHWTGAGGLDPAYTGAMGTSQISGDASVSASNSQRYTTRASGGDAFSGYIPVTPSTGYAVSAWGSSPSAGVCMPVGIDPYTADYVQGTENWLFGLNNWPNSTTWSWQSVAFTTAANTSYIKIKSELWNNCAAGTAYLDNLALRYAVDSDPTLAMGEEETNLPAPVITNIADNGPVTLGNALQVSALITAPSDEISSAVLRILSPQAAEIPMSLTSGNTTSGTWQAIFTPGQGGSYVYRIYAETGSGLKTLSARRTVTVNDVTPPVISLVSLTDPILVRNTQTLVAQVLEDGAVSSVTLTSGGNTHAMTPIGSNQYSYAWQVTGTGAISYTITATNTSNVSATLSGSFVSTPRDTDVCAWKDCRQGAASWSIDDGNTSCAGTLEAAGIRGTYYYSGNGYFNPGDEWFAEYSAAGHEIASHTLTHPCNPPACTPSCTPESLAALPVDPAVVQSYRANQLEPNIYAIEQQTGVPVITMAWPCGCTDPSRQAAAAYYLAGARGYYDSIAALTWVEDVNSTVPDNLFLLNAASTYRQDFIDRAYDEGKWAIITSHGECTGIPYMGLQNSEGKLWVAPVGEVLKYVKVRDAAQFTNYTRADQAITFNAAHSLPVFTPTPVTGSPYTFLPITYDNPVTLKVLLQETDTVLGVTVDGAPAAFTVRELGGYRYVTFDTALNTVKSVVVSLAPPPPAISNVAAAPAPVELGAEVTISADVVPAGGTSLGSVTLRVLSPIPGDFPMAHVSGTQYAAAFTPTQLGSVTYRVVATNNSGYTSQSSVQSFTVQDTTGPATRNQAQSANPVGNGEVNTLSAQGYDLGGLARAVLSVNESGVRDGAWQDYDWPAGSDWWNYTWTHRRAITLSETAGLARSNETIDIAVNAADYPGLSGCNELRVADAGRNEIPAQIAGSYPACRLLFQFSSLANAASTLYIYYGNPAAPAPSFSSDLSVTANGSLRTIENAYFNLDLNLAENAGVITRMRLPQGNNANLPLSPSTDVYWGWHQLCSSAHGNITGKNAQCLSGGEPASGLTQSETISGPLVREYTLTSVKGADPAATYTVTYRFYANAPYYTYTAVKANTPSRVMNNFWYLNGYFSRLGTGSGADPAATYNTYDSNLDHILVASLAGDSAAAVDGTDNDGTDLGGVDYRTPGSQSLGLYVVTGQSQAAAWETLRRLAAPLAVSAPGPVEDLPARVYGSPIELSPAPTTWSPVSFAWQNPAVVDQYVYWKIKFYDRSGNMTETPVMLFASGVPTAVSVSQFQARVVGDAVELSWETATESDLVGFNIYRSETLRGEREKQNPYLLPARNSGAMLGGEYVFTDEATLGKRYYYWLEVVSTGGNTLVGPVTPYMEQKLFLPALAN